MGTDNGERSRDSRDEAIRQYQTKHDTMTSNLIRLLLAVVAAITIGFFSGPLWEKVLDVMHLRDSMAGEVQRSVDEQRRLRLEQQEEHRKFVHDNTSGRHRRGVVITDSSASDDWQKGFEEDSGAVVQDASPQDTSQSDDVAYNNGAERDFSSYMLADCDPDLVGITEEKDAPEVAGQTDVVPKAVDSKARNAYAAAIRKFTTALEKAGKGESFDDPELKGNAWKKPDDIYRKLEERVLTQLGNNPTAERVMEYLAAPENRRDLALLALIRQAGIKALEDVSQQRGGIMVLSALSSNLDWLTNTMYSGPTSAMGRGLGNLALIFSRYTEDITDETARRVATTTALEFAREGWSQKDMLERFSYYYGSYRDGRLNKLFDNLAYWETRLVTGTDYRSWGSPVSLAWQRDNVRLPVEGYLGASGQLVYRLRNVAGDSVFSSEYLAPVLKGFNNVTALAHREIGGVCGACSHYGAYGALAAGIPAMTMGEPGHCAYTVRVGNEWRKGYSIYWQHSMAKTFWGLHDWEFLILTQDLYTDVIPTRASDQLAAMAEFLASKRMTKAAFNCFDAAIQAQPLNWPVWLAYAGYLKQKAPGDKERWTRLCTDVIETLAEKYHNVAATFQARYIYPNLLPLMPDKRERNKLFASFFKKCEDFGINRWDVTPLLNAQFAGCKTEAEKLDYMKTALSILMSKPDYSGPVLTWGLETSGKMSQTSGQNADRFQEEFSKLITSAMKKMRGDKKNSDSTWEGLGEAIHTAATSGDNFTFQAIGKLAMQKCKKHFPKNRFKFRGFSGRIVSANGSIQTAVTLDDNGLKQSCLHWAVLQKNGGVIPIKFEGNNGITVKLEGSSDLTGVVALFDCAIKNDRPFRIEASEDGQNWEDTGGKAEIDGSIMRIDLQKAQASARYIRLLREGDKWDTGNIVGFYVYGKLKKNS